MHTYKYRVSTAIKHTGVNIQEVLPDLLTEFMMG